MMFDILTKYLTRIGIPYDTDIEDDSLHFDVDSPQGIWKCSVLIAPNTRGLGFYSTLPKTVPRDMRTRVALYLMALNNNRLFGNFELDLKTGHVYFKTYIDCESVELTERMLDRTMLVNITTMQQCLPKIMNIIEGIPNHQLREAS